MNIGDWGRRLAGQRWLRPWLILLVTVLAPTGAWAQAGAIQGQVYGPGGSTYLIGTTVEAYDAAGVFEGSAVVQPSSFYTITGLAPGTHYIRTRVSPSQNYVDVAYGNVACAPCTMPAGTAITVNPGTIMAGHDLTVLAGSGINGFVLPAGLLGGLEGVIVRIYDSGGQFVKSDVTADDGTYSVVGLPAGTYHARTFVPSGSPYIDEAWDDIPCTPCVMGTTTPIGLGAQSFRGDIDFTLERGGQISGRVSSVSHQVGLQNVIVRAMAADGLVFTGVSQAGGTYTINGLPRGTYYVQTDAPGNYIDEVWNNVPCSPCTPQAAGSPITITGETSVTNIDFALLIGGTISGTISIARSPTAIQGATVTVFTPAGTAGISITDASGAYQVSGLAAGSYYVRVSGPPSSSYIPEAYNDVPCAPCPGVGALQAITVSTGATTGNVNFALETGGQIAGTVRNALTNALVAGVNVEILTAGGLRVTSAESIANGTYTARGIPPGTYYARVAVNGAWESELYNNLPCPHGACTITTGTPIVVTGTSTVNNISFTLQPLGPVDAVVNFGAPWGVYKLSSTQQWQQVSGFASEDMATGDLDGNGDDDLVIDFGNTRGVWAWMNHATWQFLVPFSPTAMAMGDVNGNGSDDLLLSFLGYGIWRYGDGTWTQLHPLQASHLAIANTDGNSSRDLLVSFPSAGLYLLANNTTWTALHGGMVSTLLASDLDGDGRDEVVATFPGAGLWAYRGTTWTQLHNVTPAHVATGHTDENGRAELAIDFGSLYGLWLYSNDATWTQLHAFSTQGLVFADRDASGRDELLIDFAAYGLWQYDSDTFGGWTWLHPFSPNGMTAGRLH